MINPNDYIQFRNVVSKKDRFHYKEMETTLRNFFNDITKMGGNVGNTYFYALENIPEEEILQIEVFAPIEEDYIEVKNEMKFHSYFSIDI